MTKTEFDDFIVAQGLIWEQAGAFIANSNQFAIGPGWYQITADLITDLINLGWNKLLFQVKEKFGGGRFYVSATTEEIRERISQWQNETYKICEDCGNTENVRIGGDAWKRTVCEACRTILNQKLHHE